MLAALSLENEPPELKQVFHLVPAWPDFGYAEAWVQAVGTIVAFCILVWGILHLLRRRGVMADETAQADAGSVLWGRVFLGLAIVSGAAYLFFAVTFLLPGLLQKAAVSFTGSAAGIAMVRWRILTIAAGASLLAGLIWPLRDLLGL